MKLFQILFIAMSLSVVTALAQDMTMNSNTTQGELLHVENTGSTDKIAINVISNTTSGVGVQIESGYGGIATSVFASDYTSPYGAISQAYAGDGSYPIGEFGYASGNNGATVTGLEGEAFGGDGSNDVGVYGYASGGSTPYAGLFNGSILMTGACYCTVSDEAVKQNIRPLTQGLSMVMALQPRAYEYKTDAYNGMLALGPGTQYGLVAQEVQPLLPELVHNAVVPLPMSKTDIKNHVKKTPLKLLSINYTGLIPIMLKAMQEQNARIDSLQAEIAVLQAGK